MGILATAATVVLSISFMTFVAFFGRLPIFRRTPIAWLHRAIWVHLPNRVLGLDQRLTGGRFTSSLKRFGLYMMYDKHPTVLIFFFLLLSVSQYLALPTAWPLMTGSQKASLAVVMALPYAFLYLSAYSDPGTVDATSLRGHLERYPYDFALFVPGRVCTTCRLPKPARSKHCSVCKRCVARADHHCIFINNCVGAGNQHWFLLLLFSTGLLTAYGGGLGAMLISARIQSRDPRWGLVPPCLRFFGSSSGNGFETPLTMSDWLIDWTWGLQDRVGLGSVSMLALLTSPLVWGLLAYNLYNVWCGVTTNESLKWSDLAFEMEDGIVFRRRLLPARARDPRFEADAARSRWPVEAEHVLYRNYDGKPLPGADPSRPPGEDEGGVGSGGWERVWRLRDVENLYDLGMRHNFMDVFVPGYRFGDDAGGRPGEQDLPTSERESSRVGIRARKVKP